MGRINSMTLPKPQKNVLNTILTRHSVRSYTGRTVDAISIYTLIEAAIRAPTAMHEEPWGFLVVQDKKLLHDISEKAKVQFAEKLSLQPKHSPSHTEESFARPEFDMFYGAGTLIIICAKQIGEFVTADCWLAAENMMLTASSMGLGTCVIGASVDTLNSPGVKSLLEIPQEFTAIAPIIVGYPKGEIPESPRQVPSILAWITDKA
jgi:nitroreductase